MCGIAGILCYHSAGAPADTNRVLSRMLSQIVHRGPDEEGRFLEGPVALGMRRLSIIDLQGGSQPIFDESRTLVTVFNGEIYNFLELRKDLERQGHRFRTNTDTETIVHAYEEWGPGCLDKLNGMFAFALWDLRKRELFLARDRAGKKPLYFAHLPGLGVLFASEVRGLVEHPWLWKRTVDSRALHHYLTLQAVPDPLTGFQEIRKLPPGRYALVTPEGRLRIKRYWEPVFEPKWTNDEGELAERLQELLRGAVRRRLIADVPLGAFLSGGIDSSIIVGLMAQESNTPVKTFSIGFEEERFSELPYARLIAERYATEHHEQIVSWDVEAILPEIAAHVGEPYADSSALPTWHLSRMTRRHVTVALNGDGGDEIFAGYQRYRLDRLVWPLMCMPRAIRVDLLGALTGWLPVPTNIPIERNWVLGLKRLAQVGAIDPRASIIRWGSHFSESQKRGLYTEDFARQVVQCSSEKLLARSFRHARARSFLDRTLSTDFTNYLPHDLLVKADRMAMAHSLEGRSPFLDFEVVEFVARLPERLKLRGPTHKYLLKKAFFDLLPEEIRQRPKQGFGIPLSKWFRKELQPMARDLLLSQRFQERGIVRREGVERLLREHESGRDDHGKRLWTLIMLEMWFLRFVDPQAGRTGGLA